MPPRLVNSIGHEPRTSRPRRFRCRLLIGELPQVDALAVIGDERTPLTPVRRPANPPIFRGRGAVAGFVLPVAVQRNRSQVATTIIKAISVDVIDLESVTTGEPQQFTVQADVLRAAIDTRYQMWRAL